MNRRLIAIGLLTFVNVLGFSIMIPVFPFIVDFYGGKATTYGILLSSYSIFQFIGAPILGSLSDKYGRRPILLVSQAGTALGWLIFACAYFVSPNLHITRLALPLAVMVLSRVVDGITGGNISVANAYVADVTSSHEKTRMFGILGAIFGVGFIIGPSIGGLTSSFAIGFWGTVLFALALSIATFIWMYFFLPESLPKKLRQPKLEIHFLKEINVVGKIMQYQGNRLIKQLFFIRGFFTLVFSAYMTAVVLYLKDTFVLSSAQLGILFLVMGSFLIVNQAILTGYLSKKWGDLKTFYFGQFLIFFGLVTLVSIHHLIWFLINGYIISLGISLSMITFKSLITNNVDSRKQGEINGIDESILAGGSAIAPLLAGSLYEGISQFAFGVFAIGLVIPFAYIWYRTGSPVTRVPK